MATHDVFGSRAPQYAAFRPDYPAALLDFVAGLPAGRTLAWDCATGNGQAAVGLAERFDAVLATDRSDAQLRAARPHPRVRYRQAVAEESGLPGASADLVTVAQALHWLDLRPFYAEVARVLAPGGALAVWTYCDADLEDPVLTESVRRFNRETLGPWWPPGREHVWDGYRRLPFPYAEVEAPAFSMERRWSLPDLLGYLRSWSAVIACAAATGEDLVARLVPELAAAWGDPARERTVRWPLVVRAGVRR